MELKKSNNIKKNNSFNQKEMETDEKFLERISSGVSYNDDKQKYQEISEVTAIYPIERVKEMTIDKYYNIISAKLIGEVSGTKLVEVKFERLIPETKLENKPHHR